MASAAPSKVDQLPVRAARPAVSIDGNRQTELEARLVRYALTDRALLWQLGWQRQTGLSVF